MPTMRHDSGALVGLTIAEQLEQRVGLMMSRVGVAAPRWTMDNELSGNGVECRKADAPTSHCHAEFSVEDELARWDDDQYTLGERSVLLRLENGALWLIQF